MNRKCLKCWGFGLWATGANYPIEEAEAERGFATIPCPECGQTANPWDSVYFEDDLEGEDE